MVGDSRYDIPLHQYLTWFGSKFNELLLNNQSEQIPSNEFISESMELILNSSIFFYLVMITIKNNMGQQWVSHLLATMDDYLFMLLALISILNIFLGSLIFLWFGLVIKNNYCVLLRICTCVESIKKREQNIHNDKKKTFWKNNLLNFESHHPDTLKRSLTISKVYLLKLYTAKNNNSPHSWAHGIGLPRNVPSITNTDSEENGKKTAICQKLRSCCHVFWQPSVTQCAHVIMQDFCNITLPCLDAVVEFSNSSVVAARLYAMLSILYCNQCGLYKKKGRQGKWLEITTWPITIGLCQTENTYNKWHKVASGEKIWLACWHIILLNTGLI